MTPINVATDGLLGNSSLSIATRGWMGGTLYEGWKEIVRLSLYIFKQVQFNG